ncbi:MAG: MFS transporter [Candidatus Bathyarchaeia archaeon]
MWRLGFFIHEMAFGLLSVFLPLYIIAVGGSLIDVGIMSATALFLVIPASFFWGYICDRTRRYKRYILLSFFTTAVILYLFTFTTSVSLLIILYTLMSILHIAHEAPKNVLVAELYSHSEWKKAFAFYEGFTEIGWLFGLLLGFAASTYNLNSGTILLLCSGLNFVAFLISIFLITDPVMIFERRLVSIEKTIDFTYKGVILASKIMDGLKINEKLRRENVNAFCTGLILFSLATSILFTPLPIFFSKILALPTSIIFAIYALNSIGGVTGYFMASTDSEQWTEKTHICKIVLTRSILTILLIPVLYLPTGNIVLATLILTLMGFAYAMFLVRTLSLSMELIPAGKAGLFNVLTGVGGACGSFIGPYMAQTLGFAYVFVTASALFLLSYLAFKIFA